MMLYLSRFSQGEKFHGAKDFYAWKGYDFEILSELDDADYIRQGNHPSRSKSVYIMPKNHFIKEENMSTKKVLKSVCRITMYG